MKKILGLFMALVFAGIMCVGCTPAEKDKAGGIIEKVVSTTEVISKAAAIAGVPFAGTAGVAVAFLGTTVLAFLGRGSQKRKKEALYQSTADLHTEANRLAVGLKDKSISVEQVIKMLPGMVKDVTAITHTAYNQYKAIEKDINKYQKKGMIKKLT